MVDYGIVEEEPPWALLRERGVEYVYLKASKSTVEEPVFATWWAHAKACGLKRGAYAFLCAPRDVGAALTCPQEDRPADAAAYGRAQGQALATALAEDPGELPPVLDVEARGGFLAEQHAQNLASVRAAAQAVQESTGQKPIIYGGTLTFHTHVCGGEITACCADAPFRTDVFWQAAYGVTPPTLGACWSGSPWSLWQFRAGTGGDPDWSLVDPDALQPSR